MHEKILDLKRFFDFGKKSYELKRQVIFLDEKKTSKNINLINSQKDGFFEYGNKFEKSNNNLFHDNCIIATDLMNDEIYSIHLYFNSSEMRPFFQVSNIISFEVVDRERNYAYFGRINGAVRPKLKWIVS